MLVMILSMYWLVSSWDAVVSSCVDFRMVCFIIGIMTLSSKLFDVLVKVMVVLCLIIWVYIINVVFGIIGLILLGMMFELGCRLGRCSSFRLVRGFDFIYCRLLYSLIRLIVIVCS